VDFLETESAVIFKTLRTDLSRLDTAIRLSYNNKIIIYYRVRFSNKTTLFYFYNILLYSFIIALRL